MLNVVFNLAIRYIYIYIWGAGLGRSEGERRGHVFPTTESLSMHDYHHNNAEGMLI